MTVSVTHDGNFRWLLHDCRYPVTEISIGSGLVFKVWGSLIYLQSSGAVCECRGGRPGLPAPNSPYGLCGHTATSNCSISELRSCEKVEMAILSSPSLINLMVSANVTQH